MNFIKHNFGSYSGYLNHLQARIAAGLGQYASATKIDWPRVERLVFVCKGNVCRSPYAEAKAKNMGFPAVSFGLETTGGVPANASAQRAAQLRKIDLSAHRSRLFDAGEVTRCDLVLGFEPLHLEQLLHRAAATNAQFSLVGMWTIDAVRPLIADPFGKSDEYFQACFAVIDRSVEGLTQTGRSSKSV